MMLSESDWELYSYRSVLAAFVRGSELSRQEKVLLKLKSHSPSILTETWVKDVQEILKQATQYVVSECKFSKDFIENLHAVLFLPTVLTNMIKEYLGAAVGKIAKQADSALVVEAAPVVTAVSVIAAALEPSVAVYPVLEQWYHS